jgi:phospholipase/carboxylesterase
MCEHARMTDARASSLIAVLASCLTFAALACEPGPTPKPHAPAPATPEPATPEPAPRDAEPTLQLVPDLELPELAGVQYLEIVTGSAEANAELPMIIALHGNGAFPRQMAYALLQDPSAARPAFPVRWIFLRGTQPVHDLGPGYARWFSITTRDALASPDQLAALSSEILDRSNEVAAAISSLTAARPTIGKPILTGHSQGGILTYGLAIGHPELFAAAFPVSGWLPAPLWPKQPADPAARALKIVALHGAQDTVVSFEAAARSVEQLRALDYTIEQRPFSAVKHELSPMLEELHMLLAEAATQ